MTSAAFIDEDAVRRRREDGLTREQCLLIVARSAVVRYLASRQQPFVLKGGALLHHVYESPRYSIKDADFTRVDAPDLMLDDLLKTLKIRDDSGFELDPELGTWTTENELFRWEPAAVFEGRSA